MDVISEKQQFENAINIVVSECRKENNIFNPVIRDDVFIILELHCTVIYYPLENEDINGFHVLRTINGCKTHFVYINTANPIERQVFAAAHELGHILDVYGKVKQLFPQIDSYALSMGASSPEEYVVNKFTAQLLMPDDLFTDVIEKCLKKFNYNGRSISKINMLRLIANLMDTFLVGFKATTIKLVEIGRLQPDVYDKVKDFEYEPEYNKTIEKILKEDGLKRLVKHPTPNRNISNLTEIIRNAEKSNCDLISTISLLKDEFEINTTEPSDHDSEVIF